MKRAFAGAGLFIVLACTIAACVGDDPKPVTSGRDRDPDPNIAVGREGGACDANQQCLDGLECVRGKICLPPEDGGTSSTDGGLDSASNDVPSSDDDAEAGSTTCTSYSAAAFGQVRCGGPTCPAGGGATVCCMQPTNPPTCTGSCVGAGKKIACDSPEDCNGGFCCLAPMGTLTKADVCSSGVDYSLLKETHCSSGCIPAASELRICNTDDDCAGLAGAPKCLRIDVKNSTTKLEMGACL